MVDQCFPSSKPSKAFTNSSSHLQTQRIRKRQVSDEGFKKYEIRDTMRILTQNWQYTKYTHDKYIKVTLEKKRRKWNDKGYVGKT